MHSRCVSLLIQVQWNSAFTSLLRPPYFVPVKRLYILLKSLTVQNFIKTLIYSATLKLVMFILPLSIFCALIQIQFSNIISAFRINKEDLQGQLWSRVTVTQFGEVMRFEPNPLIRALRRVNKVQTQGERPNHKSSGFSVESTRDWSVVHCIHYVHHILFSLFRRTLENGSGIKLKWNDD